MKIGIEGHPVRKLHLFAPRSGPYNIYITLLLQLHAIANIMKRQFIR